MKLERIGTVRSCFGEKFGTPRQPGLCPSAWGWLVFDPGFGSPEMLRGLDGFSHIWLVFGFDRCPAGAWSSTVRPPRLGGDRRVGVWASRSPFRPNGLGLSLVRLEQTVTGDGRGPILKLGGVDLVDGTPVFDIKPYLPYCEALADASGGYADAAPGAIRVTVDPAVRPAFESLPERARAVVGEVLAADPRPAVAGADDGRIHGARMCGCDIRFVVSGGGCRLVGVDRCPASGLSDDSGYP
jgi:tRNA-Thr(GGU) m(6)t(6)A37 methyltransferase TsaA